MMQNKTVSLLNGDLKSPIMIPSFSTFTDAHTPLIFTDLIKELAPALPEIFLVSSFDIYHGSVDINAIHDALKSRILMVDSGCYESQRAIPYLKQLGVEGTTVWDESKMMGVYQSLPVSQRYILVGYDKFSDIITQWDAIKHLVERFPSADHCFLLKPDRSPTLCSMVDQIQKLKDQECKVRLIGVTEKELGNSFQEKMEILKRIKMAFDAIGWNIPIHVFGGMNIQMIPKYVNAGASVFDGLSWLRYRFHGDKSLHIDTVMASRDENRDLRNHYIKIWIKNLNQLKKLEEALRR